MKSGKTGQYVWMFAGTDTVTSRKSYKVTYLVIVNGVCVGIWTYRIFTFITTNYSDSLTMVFLEAYPPEACLGYVVVVVVILPTLIYHYLYCYCQHLLFFSMPLFVPPLEPYISASQKYIDLQSSQLAALTQNQGILYSCGWSEFWRRS